MKSKPNQRHYCHLAFNVFIEGTRPACPPISGGQVSRRGGALMKSSGVGSRRDRNDDEYQERTLAPIAICFNKLRRSMLRDGLRSSPMPPTTIPSLAMRWKLCGNLTGRAAG